MVAAVWGAILIALFVTVATELFNMSEEEIRAITLVDVSRKAARVIVHGIRYYKAKKMYYIQCKKNN